MALLRNLLNERTANYRRGFENLSTGRVWAWTHTNVTGTINRNACTFCWTSPGTGVAVVELWGASGSGGQMCCCSGSGIPGNPGAYSRKTICVCGTSYVCGWVGCSPTGNCLCYPGRSECSVACPFNTSDNTVVTSQGGFGGYTNCSTSTAHYCCLVAAGFQHTLTNSFCGILCNVGGPNGSNVATASGGDINISGGISCMRMYECTQCYECNYEMTLAVSAGIFSSTCSTCFRFMRQSWPYDGWAHSGQLALENILASYNGVPPGTGSNCWSTASPSCACYEHEGCVLGGVGVPGTTGHPCVNVRASGVKGGHGGVRITFY